MSDPLFQFEWNQAEEAQELEPGLFTVVAKDTTGKFHAVGTGFVVIARDDIALALSAGHVLLEVQSLQDSRKERSHHSTLAEFAPPKRPIDVSLSGLAMLTRVGPDVLTSRVDGLALDELGDVAVMQLRPQHRVGSAAALRQFMLEDRDPNIGDLVCIASYADLACETQGPNQFQLARKPILRVGKVTQVFPEGQRLCRGPCFETSIPVFSGMSGSPVIYYDSLGAMRALGLVCSDPDADGPVKNDRSVAGRSLVARLPVQRLSGTAKGRQEVVMSFAPTSVAGTLASLSEIVAP